MKRVCVGLPSQPCGRITDKRRCKECAAAYELTRTRRSKGHYDAAWRKVRDRAIREHPWCEVCRTPGDEGNPLTGDHRIPWSRGGRAVRSNVAVLCRRHNSSKGAGPVSVTP